MPSFKGVTPHKETVEIFLFILTVIMQQERTRIKGRFSYWKLKMTEFCNATKTDILLDCKWKQQLLANTE